LANRIGEHGAERCGGHHQRDRWMAVVDGQAERYADATANADRGERVRDPTQYAARAPMML
jgi:hypothetical protein